MATIYENLDTIKNSINRMKVALELTETTPLEEVTIKVEEGTGGDILNGVIESYKAYTEGESVTISANTFIEFVKSTNSTVFNSGHILFISEYGENAIIVYNTSSSCVLAKITFDKEISIMATTTVCSSKITLFTGLLTDDDLILSYNKGSRRYEKNINLVSFTFSNELNSANCFYENMKLVKVENNIKYFVFSNLIDSYSTYSNIQTYSLENNVLTYINGFNTFYNIGYSSVCRPHNIYEINNQMFVTQCRKTGFGITIFNIDETYSVDATYTTTLDYLYGCDVCVNNNLFVIYQDKTDNYLKVSKIEIGDNTVTPIATITLQENTGFDYKNLMCGNLGDKLYTLHRESSSLPYTITLIDPTTLEILDSFILTDIASVTKNYITHQEFLNDLFIAVQSDSSVYQDTLFMLKNEDNKISTSDTTVIESVTKIEGITKTECTSEVAGEVWLLNS